MLPKPAHLGPAYAAQFSDMSVVEAYHLRPPYPSEASEVLGRLVVDQPRAVLDVGCGTGELARPLARLVSRVDALDPSAGMLAKGSLLFGGDASNLRWIHGSAEATLLDGPYALIVAGASLHWMEWDVAIPRFRTMLTPSGMLVIVEDHEVPNPWDADLGALIQCLSTNQDYQPYDLIEELEHRHLFHQIGRYETAPVPFEQSLAEYVESFHARNGLSRDRMHPDAAAAFDQELVALMKPHIVDNMVHRRTLASLVWGRPA